MPRRNSSLEALRVRKQLLLLEAEVHRSQLQQDWNDLKNCTHHFKEKAKSAQSLFGLASLVMTGFSIFRTFRRGAKAGSPSIFKLLLGALAAVTRFTSRSQES
jgi:hypothetical protein